MNGDAHKAILTNPVFNFYPAQASAPAVPRLLPPRLADFTGRAEEVARILLPSDGAGEHYAPDRIVVVSGTPGVGKTALATHVAHHPDGDFPHGRLYADLRGMGERPAEPEEVMARFLVALGTPQAELPGDPHLLLDAYRLALAGRRVLVVLDNAKGEEQVRPLIPAGGGSTVLITSRSRLAGLEGAQRLDLDTFSPEVALEFLRGVCGAERVDRGLADAEQVVDFCGRLPLALRISANRLSTNRYLRMADLARELRQERDRLGALEAGDLTVRAAFSLSYRRLNKAAIKVFRRLSQVPGDHFGPGICAALTGSSEREAARELRKLAEMSLIEPAPGPGCYRFHDLLRVFAREQLTEEAAESVADNAARMNDWLLRSALRAQFAVTGLPMPSFLQDGNVARVDSAQDAARWTEENLSSALPTARQLIGAGAPERAAVLAGALTTVCEATGNWPAWEEACRAGLEAAELVGDRQIGAGLMLQRANLARARREFGTAMEIAEEVRELTESLGDPMLTADTLNLLGGLHMDTGALERARPLLEQSLHLWQDLANPRETSKVLFNLGTVHRALGEFETAIRYFRSDLETCESLGDEPGTAETLNTLALTLLDVDDPSTAEQYQHRALEIFRRIGNPYKESMVTNDLALTLRHQGRNEEALAAQLADAEACRALGYRSGEAVARSNASVTLTMLGRTDEALGLNDEAVAVLTELGDRQRLAQALSGRSLVLFGAGLDDQAIATADRALELMEGEGQLKDRADLHFALALEHEGAGRHREALHHVEAFLAVRELPPGSPRIRSALVIARQAALELADHAKARHYQDLLTPAD
ncbi:hypothetical protein GCM10009738_43440 [Kitasatospora viridis]